MKKLQNFGDFHRACPENEINIKRKILRFSKEKKISGFSAPIAGNPDIVSNENGIICGLSIGRVLEMQRLLV